MTTLLKRGQNCSLTTHIKNKKLKLPYKHLPTEGVSALPFLLIVGLKKKVLDPHYDVNAIAEWFAHDYTNANHLEATRRELWKYVESIKNPTHDEEKITVLLWNGFQDFDTKFLRELWSIWEESKHLQAKFGNPLIDPARYLLSGYSNYNWYEKTLAEFRKNLSGYDMDLFIKLFAITSPMNNFQANLRHAIKAYESFDSLEKLERLNFLPSSKKMLLDFKTGELDFKNPPRNKRRKIINFANALLGQKDAIVVDSRLLEACGLIERYEHKGRKYSYSHRISEYDFVEMYIKSLAKVSGFEPRQVVSMLWGGVRKANSKFKLNETREVLKKVLV